MAKRLKGTQSIFGQGLTSIMKERGISIREAAKMAGVGPSTIDSWRSGRNPENLIAVKKLAKGLGLSFSFLLTGENEHLSAPSITETFDSGEIFFDGYAKISIQRLVPKKEK